MGKYFFTFGANHETKSGVSLGNNYVIIEAEDERTARDIMWQARGAKWAFSYPEEFFGTQAVDFNLGELPLETVRLYENKEESTYSE